jgi:endonuclease V-like protein UPF0215 family
MKLKDKIKKTRRGSILSIFGKQEELHLKELNKLVKRYERRRKIYEQELHKIPFRKLETLVQQVKTKTVEKHEAQKIIKQLKNIIEK